MYCVIQEIETRRMQKNGYPKRIETYFTESNVIPSYYGYCYSTERFERPFKKAYRISIHESYREAGRIKKKQFVICTVNYYSIADDSFNLYDWGDSRINIAVDALCCSSEFLYDLIEKKLNPLKEHIQAEFAQTEEFKVHKEHERVTTLYAARKANFNERYGTVGSNIYDQCYDVYGVLQNPQRLKEIEAEYIDRKDYEQKSQERSRRYYEKSYSNYTGSGSNTFGSISGQRNAEDKVMLKQFYRTLSKAYHPDSNPGKDTSEEMKLLNQIKMDWGL
ncbi:MAG: hypothetical protein LBN31_16480 [Hungatella sp.]|jgi:hypothetical protein|nr:hypothetical protein [Hungatella sp.]